MQSMGATLVHLRAVLLGSIVFGVTADGSAQARRISASVNDYLLEITQEWGRESPLGLLQDRRMAPDDLELRFWSGYGLVGTRGLVLRREAGAWRGWRAQVEPCLLYVPASVAETLQPPAQARYRQLAVERCGERSPRAAGIVIQADTLALVALPQGADYDSLWQLLRREGVLELPPDVPRSWGLRDGHSYVVEVRHGDTYRASVIQRPPKPEVKADSSVDRLEDLLGVWSPAN
jgi:hypothetical protein